MMFHFREIFHYNISSYGSYWSEFEIDQFIFYFYYVKNENRDQYAWSGHDVLDFCIAQYKTDCHNIEYLVAKDY